MIAGSVADNLGLSDHQLHLILVENCADCWFAGFRLQAATATASSFSTHPVRELQNFFRVLTYQAFPVALLTFPQILQVIY